MKIMDLLKKREIPEADKEPHPEYAPPYIEPQDITLWKLIRKLNEIGAKYEIDCCGMHITNKV